jgi:hypothetical protein
MAKENRKAKIQNNLGRFKLESPWVRGSRRKHYQMTGSKHKAPPLVRIRKKIVPLFHAIFTENIAFLLDEKNKIMAS